MSIVITGWNPGGYEAKVIEDPWEFAAWCWARAGEGRVARRWVRIWIGARP